MPPVVLVIGSRDDRMPSGLAGIFAGSSDAAAPRGPGAGEDERELFRRFSAYCAARSVRCVWLRHMRDAHVTVDYVAAGASLKLAGLPELEGQEMCQDALRGAWYRGLPEVPAFASDDDQAYVERETEAFWEGYCHHVPMPVLNRPRTIGLRPAVWEKPLLRHLLRTESGLPVRRDGLAGRPPRTDADRVYQALSTRRPLRPGEAAGCGEQSAWVEAPSPGQSAVLAIHVGPEVLLARPHADGTAEPLAPEALPPALAGALVRTTATVARLLGEDFGATLWDVDVRPGRFAFRDFTPNPEARALLPLAPRLLPLIFQYLNPR
jgi:hypothetical protein